MTVDKTGHAMSCEILLDIVFYLSSVISQVRPIPEPPWPTPRGPNRLA